jgi:hypothetical protein
MSFDAVPDDPATNFRADSFYRIIAPAIEQLPNNEREVRQNFYDRARAMVTNKLHGQAPSLIAHEQRALEKAIRRVEANVAESERYRPGVPPSYLRAADATVQSSPPQPQMPLLLKLLLAILLGAVIAAALAQLPIRLD